jgi:hypothetical protein
MRYVYATARLLLEGFGYEQARTAALSRPGTASRTLAVPTRLHIRA